MLCVILLVFYLSIKASIKEEIGVLLNQTMVLSASEITGLRPKELS